MAAQQGWCTQFSYLEDIDNNASGGVAAHRGAPSWACDVPLLLITVKGFGRMKIGQSVRKVNKITPSRGTYFFFSFCLHNGQVLVISFQKFSIPGYQWTPVALYQIQFVAISQLSYP